MLWAYILVVIPISCFPESCHMVYERCKVLEYVQKLPLCMHIQIVMTKVDVTMNTNTHSKFVNESMGGKWISAMRHAAMPLGKMGYGIRWRIIHTRSNHMKAEKITERGVRRYHLRCTQDEIKFKSLATASCLRQRYVMMKVIDWMVSCWSLPRQSSVKCDCRWIFLVDKTRSFPIDFWNMQITMAKQVCNDWRSCVILLLHQTAWRIVFPHTNRYAHTRSSMLNLHSEVEWKCWG